MWEGFDLESAEVFLADSGKAAFLAEYMHDFTGYLSEKVLPHWRDEVHVASYNAQLAPLHLVVGRAFSECSFTPPPKVPPVLKQTLFKNTEGARCGGLWKSGSYQVG